MSLALAIPPAKIQHQPRSIGSPRNRSSFHLYLNTKGKLTLLRLDLALKSNGIFNQIAPIHPDRLYLWKEYATPSSCNLDGQSNPAQFGGTATVAVHG